jgi:FkbM family methyltransferase
MITRLANFLRRRNVDLDTFGAVFELGSRDARQAIELAGLFTNGQIIAVECNPHTLELCRTNAARHPRITLIDKAIHSYTGRCQFHPIDTARTVTSWPDGNPGASSLFLATGDYPAERYVQNTIEVDCIRLDALCKQLGIGAIDLIWMDLQGAELLALQSAGALLDKTRYIYTEVSHRPLYQGQPLFDEVDAFLQARGFRCCSTVDRSNWQQDLIYENTRPLIDVVMPLTAQSEDTIELSVRSVHRCVRHVRHIYLLSRADPAIEGTHHVDEQAFPFDRAAIQQLTGSAAPAECYLQQLLKLHFQLVQRGALEHVLAVDADTLFLKPCRFMDAGRPIVNFGGQYQPRCFEHMTRLHPELHRMMAWSGITHATLFTRAWLKELHEAVEAHHSGKPFWAVYLSCIDPATSDLSASDAELYFNFCLRFHPSEVTIRRFNWMNTSEVEVLSGGSLDYVHLQRQSPSAPVDRLKLEQLLASGSAAQQV